MKIDPISAFNDNYIWCLSSTDNHSAVVVDPGDAAPVISHLQKHGLRLSAILITHKHWDHIGGIRQLINIYPGIPVYGPRNEAIEGVTDKVCEGESIELQGIDAVLDVLDVPGHTEGHVAYLGKGVLFCGDTLFAAGCGRVFSGTHAQLYASLQKIASLSPATRLFCAHEYTLDNLGFAQWVEPESIALRQRIQRDRASREAGLPTVPSTLEEELATNPFLRCHIHQAKDAAEKYVGKQLSNGEAVFTAVRNWKDREYD
ncbi:MAG TPA: hydroxyacylglutathione hydrolase [Gammaproteobacteria bacterium]|nr:hydroxyacylglutathione hydrolase [Gammaproteobacteria bacterium]